MNNITIELPAWLQQYQVSYHTTLSEQAQMRFVIEAARLNIREQTGGPFAAAVIEQNSGKLVSLGVNLVTSQKLSILHAEMVAITLAQRTLGVYDLGAAGLPAHTLLTSTEPCAMCFGAIPWSGISRVVTAATDADARAIGFDEGAKPQDWTRALIQRGIEVQVEVCREDAVRVLQDYLAADGHVYNSREH